MRYRNVLRPIPPRPLRTGQTLRQAVTAKEEIGIIKADEMNLDVDVVKDPQEMIRHPRILLLVLTPLRVQIHLNGIVAENENEGAGIGTQD